MQEPGWRQTNSVEKRNTVVFLQHSGLHGMVKHLIKRGFQQARIAPQMAIPDLFLPI
jgi:hypothetical protein